MVNHKWYMFAAYAVLFCAAPHFFAQRVMRTKTTQAHNYVNISSDSALRDAIKKYPVVVIKAYSPNCPHCIKYESAFNAAAKELAKVAYFVAYNADEKKFDSFSDEYDVDSLPTTLIFVNGALKTKKIGGLSQNALAEEIKKASALQKVIDIDDDTDDMDEDDIDEIDVEEEIIIKPASKPVVKPTPKKKIVVKKEEHKSSCCAKKPAKPVCPKPAGKSAAHAGVKLIATQAEYDKIVGGSSLVVVKFFGTWCGPCKSMAPRFEKIAEKYAGKVAFIEIDVDKTDDALHGLVQKEAPTLPRLLFVKNGQKVDTLGNAPDHVIEAMIQNHLK